MPFYRHSITNFLDAASRGRPQVVTLIGNPYMFTARAYDMETGLYYYRARYYNPHIGRFLQVDLTRDKK